MLPIENKIVFTDGNYETPYISEIIEVLTDHSTDFEKVKERIFNVERGKFDKEDEGRIIKQMFGDGFVVSYRSDFDGVYGWEDGRRKGKTRRTVIRNYLNKQYRKGNDNKINGIKAGLKESAFSMPKTSSEQLYSSDNLNAEVEKLLDCYESGGEMSREEFFQEMDDLYGRAVENYGAFMF